MVSTTRSIARRGENSAFTPAMSPPSTPRRLSRPPLTPLASPPNRQLSLAHADALNPWLTPKKLKDAKLRTTLKTIDDYPQWRTDLDNLMLEHQVTHYLTTSPPAEGSPNHVSYTAAERRAERSNRTVLHMAKGYDRLRPSAFLWLEA